jgi:hypothetical protein
LLSLHHHTETEYLNGTDPAIDSICMQSEPSSDVRHIEGYEAG